MVRFYDPIDMVEQRHVEQLLRRGGIEYFLGGEADPGLDSRQILIAEEDVAEAERLLARNSCSGACCTERRTATRMRASSSLMPNGLVR